MLAPTRAGRRRRVIAITLTPEDAEALAAILERAGEDRATVVYEFGDGGADLRELAEDRATIARLAALVEAALPPREPPKRRRRS
jgi:hypothetical protein